MAATAAVSAFPPAHATVNPAAFDLEQVDRGQAALSRLIGLGRYAELDDDAGTLSITPLTHPEAAALDWSRPGTLAGDAGGLEVQDLTRFVALLTGIDLAACADAPAAHRSWFAAAAAGRLSRTPLGQVHEIIEAPAAGLKAARTLRLTVNDGDHAVSVCARADARTWISMLGQGAWQRQRNSMSGYRSLGVKRRIRLASHTMPGTAARALRPGDIVIPDTPLFDSAGNGTIVLGRLRVDVCFTHPSSLGVLGMSEHFTDEKDDGMSDPFNDDSEVLYRADQDAQEESGEWDQNEPQHEGEEGGQDGDGAPEYADDQHEQPQQAPARQRAPAQPVHAADAAEHVMPHDPLLDELPLTMHFELGQLDLPLAELRTIGEGVILPLRNGSPRSIAICVSGKRLGTGEAVEVDGQLAIRVTQWSPAK